jgi:predicted aldo/keto reductase-like oxidoreductase
MMESVEAARRAMDLPVVDIFLLHEIREAPDLERRAGAWRALLDARENGWVRAIGLSTHHVDATREAAKIAALDVIFPLINIQGLGIREGRNPGTKEAMADAIAACAAAGKGVFTMKAFGGGNLCADYREALDFVTNLPGVDSVAIGMGCEKDVDDAVSYFEGRMPADFKPDVAQKRMRVDQGDCEGCGACIRRCTSKAIHFNQNGLAEIDGEACVNCGYCAPVCPVRAIILI